MNIVRNNLMTRKSEQMKIMEEVFENKDRNRYYGLRVGDIVSPKEINGKESNKGVAKVIKYGFMDNNSVIIRFEDGTETDWVAEWCDIITKVEYQEPDFTPSQPNRPTHIIKARIKKERGY